MRFHLSELYTTYLVNIFATLNNLNLKMHEYNHYSSVNAFKVTLKLWHLYQKYGVFPHTLNQLL